MTSKTMDKFQMELDQTVSSKPKKPAGEQYILQIILL